MSAYLRVLPKYPYRILAVECPCVFEPGNEGVNIR